MAETEGALHGLLETVIAGAEVSADEYVVLRVVTLRPPMTFVELRDYLAGQRQLRLDVEQAAAVLRRLEDAVLLVAPSDGGPVTVTARGADLHAAIFASVRAASGAVFAGFDCADLETTRRVLAELRERATRLVVERAAA